MERSFAVSIVALVHPPASPAGTSATVALLSSPPRFRLWICSLLLYFAFALAFYAASLPWIIHLPSTRPRTSRCAPLELRTPA